MPLQASDVDHFGVPCKNSTNMRTLHWVTKIGSLRNSLRFYELVFGFRVLRHEEFESGCEATCNGPYGGAWSKTMIGLGNENSNFVFELTYNYGINSYASGNDVQYFAIAMPEAVPRATALGYTVEYSQGIPVICGPDNFKHKIVEPAPGREERFLAVALRSSSLEKSKAYWCGVLGMSEFPTPSGCDSGSKASLTVGWAADQTHLHFVDVGDGAAVDHAKASGRIANSCRAVEPFFNAAKASGMGSIMNTPITLPTPGKADVVVTILADPDGYEICFVGDVGFYDLAKPLYDRVDWGLRAARGGDGAAPPKVAKLEPAKGMTTVTTAAEVAKLAAASKGVVLDFGAGWCKNCVKLKPFCEELAGKHPGVAFAAVDIDEADELCDQYDVSSVPHSLC
jgi:thiol-disulfide isomerase/thioredoxin